MYPGSTGSSAGGAGCSGSVVIHPPPLRPLFHNRRFARKMVATVQEPEPAFMLSAVKEKRMRQNWPEKLWLVRHGQSQGNVARDAADEAGLHEIDIDVRDVDVPLVRARHAPGRGGRPLVRRAAAATSGPRSSCPRLIFARARPRRRSARPAALAGGPAEADHRRAAARARVRHLRPADQRRHPRRNSRRKPRTAPSSANSTTGRPAARAGPT